ncbi:MAG: 3-dehydroquinate synthase family protein [Bacteroidales bacterium]|nr:3-dehydroquinate synthase family protein [Bacteroidales bacterium]
MNKIEISGDWGSSRVYTGTQWRKVTDLIDTDRVVIITDDNVRKYYGEDFPDYPVLSMPPGEDNKNLGMIENLAGALLQMGMDREGFLLGVGGGVVCDITGFLASVYFRGIRFGFISTTLLSQVDASIGGKNGVNCSGAKNVIGLFNHPEFVICDPSMLTTLPEEEYSSGLAELLKTALIGDAEMVELIAGSIYSLRKRDLDLLNILITRAVEIKAGVVMTDMRESGQRRILNFGHTFGHGAEMEYGILHGQAVAWGMRAALEFSVRRGFLEPEEKQTIDLLFNDLSIMPDIPFSGEKIAMRISFDKKRSGDDIFFVFLCGRGNAVVSKVPIREITGFISEYN